MSKIVQFLFINLLKAGWDFLVTKLKKLQRDLNHKAEVKKLEDAKKEIKDRALKYKATKKVEDVINDKK